MKFKKEMRKAVTMLCILALLLTCCSTAFCTEAKASENNEVMEEELELRNYYYNQLNDIEKAIYDNLVKAKEDFINGKEVMFAIHTYNKTEKYGLLYYYKIVMRAIKAYTYDNPEAEIWFDNYQREYFHGKDYTYMRLIPIANIKEQCNVSYEEDTPNAVKELETIATEFISTLHGTDREKLKQIHDWLVKRAIYDKTLELPNTRTVYGTIVKARSVCSGFAYAYKYLANLAGLDVLYVTGKAYDQKLDQFMPHAWNVVKLDGEYLLVDVTFDLSKKEKPSSKFFLMPLKDDIHYNETYYFSFPF